ncbi:hypothetical protein NE865_09619 [Phthorimaea operculella]|nr:hypothetical protein NE865_09619 [Phthorimaea operculella]
MQVIPGADFSLNDSANAARPVVKLKKSEFLDPKDIDWEEFQIDDYDLFEEVNADGSKKIVYKKKKKAEKPEPDNIEDRPGIVYPEIVWYFISRYLTPEQIFIFALLCKDAYRATHTEAFWRRMYDRYCKSQRKQLPKRLRVDPNYRAYGLRQRVIRALYHTYTPFNMSITLLAHKNTTPHMLVKRRCVNVWYAKGTHKWNIYFKLKKPSLMERYEAPVVNFVDELGRIDANSEEGVKLLQVSCNRFQDVPPVMGMTLSSVNIGLAQGFRYHKVVLGFSTSPHIYKNVPPDCRITLDTVSVITVLDWWHPMYPHSDDKALPVCDTSAEAKPVLEQDFFDPQGDM